MVLLVALPAGALVRVPPPDSRPDAGLHAQVRTGIPAEVQGWFEAAKAASAKGDSAEALRLQQQVMVWVQANRPALDGFRARALFNLRRYLSERGQPQEALAPTEEAVKFFRERAKVTPAAQANLARYATHLAMLQLQLANPSAALPLLKEAVSTDVTYLQAQLPLLPEARRLALVETLGIRSGRFPSLWPCRAIRERPWRYSRG